MAISRLCTRCDTKHAQHASRPYCASCARELGLALPYRYRRNADTPPIGPKPIHRVVTPIPPPLAPIPDPAPARRTITVNGCDYDVIFDGRGPLPGAPQDTPRG